MSHFRRSLLLQRSVATDIAVVAFVTGDEFFLSPIPYVGFAYNFGP